MNVQAICDCQCPITPLCITSKSFNPITCPCECDIIYNNNRILNNNLCICENKNILQLPCPGGVQIRNPISNECECESTLEYILMSWSTRIKYIMQRITTI